jgi:ABC-type transporter Mla subunit MlaD
MATLARTRNRGPRRDHPRARATFFRGVVVIIVAGLLGFQLLRLYNGVPGENYGKAYVETPIIGNLLSHDAVRVAGKRVGQILKTDVGPGGEPRVELQLNPGTKLTADTGVRIRANGLLGARFVELVPGKSTQLLKNGATIRGTSSSYTYGLPEAIDVFDSKTRKGIQQTVGGLGAGMLNNGSGLNTTIQIAALRAPQFQSVMDSISGRQGAAARLFPALDSAFVTFDRNTKYVYPWLNALGDALVPFIKERDATRATLDAAPPALTAAAGGLSRGTKLLASIRHLSSAAAVTLPPAPAGVRSLNTLLKVGGPIVQSSTGFIGQARAGLNAPWDVSPGLDKIRPRLEQLIQNVKPLLTELDDHTCDFKNAAATLRSMTGFEQNAAGAELGQAMAFRLTAVVPGTDGVGLDGPGVLVKRSGYPADCLYKSRPYPQFDGTTNGNANGVPATTRKAVGK